MESQERKERERERGSKEKFVGRERKIGIEKHC